MRHLVALVLLLAIFVSNAIRLASRVDAFVKRSAAAVIIAATTAGPMQQLAVAASTEEPALRNVARVYYSLAQVNEEIAKTADAASIRRQCNLLVSNYKLKDNLRMGLKESIPKKQRESARLHGVTALEDLALVNEYYEDDLNNQTGRKSPPREMLGIAEKATVAAREELKLYIMAAPSGASMLDDVKQEFTYTN